MRFDRLENLSIFLVLAVCLLLTGTLACNGNGGENGPDDGDTPPGEEPTPEPAPDSGVLVRRNIASFSDDDVTTLRNAVQAMKDRPVTDPTSWMYQANIHGTTASSLQPAWKTCQHGSFFFLSWHRMYLYYFERILRDATGDPETTLTLPYWDYTASTPDARQIPRPFREPRGESNPLWVSERSSILNAGGLLPESAVDTRNAFWYRNFCSPNGSGLSFGGQQVASPVHLLRPHSAFETTPHDAVHGTISGLMGSVSTAAQDPIFWLHHANIDRLWKRWLDQGGDRGHANASNWLSETFTFFDENGTSVTLTGQQVLDTAAILPRGYRYDDDPSTPPPDPPQPCETLAEEAEPVTLAASEEAITLGAGTATLDLEARPVEEGEMEDREIALNVEGVQVERQPGAIYEIYVNLPEGAEATYESPHYVGNLAFFGVEEGEESGALFSYRITDLVTRLREAGEWGDEPQVTFVRRGPEPPPGGEVVVEEEEPPPVRIRRVTVTTEPPLPE